MQHEIEASHAAETPGIIGVREQPKTLTTKQRLIAGAIGGLTPALLNIVAVDASTLFATHVDPHIALGYVTRYAALCILGAFVAYLHDRENDLRKLVQLGIVAPALLTAYMNGANLSKGAAPQGLQTPPAQASSGSSGGMAVLNVLVSSANAAPLPQLPAIQPIQFQPSTGASRFWQGFTGEQSKFYLALGLFPNVQAAQVMANTINSDPRLPPGFNVYYFTSSPFGQGISLVVGPNLNAGQAQFYASMAGQLSMQPFLVVPIG